MTLRVIDISANNGSALNWTAVAQAGVTGAFCKLSEGVGYFDTTAPANATGVKEHLSVLGYYHFARPDLANTPQQEAHYFLSCLPALEPGTLLALDMEVPTSGRGSVDAWALEWLATVEQQTEVRPFVYTGRWYAYDLGRLSAAELGGYPLWDAAYSPQQPHAYNPWAQVTLWQHTDSLALPGVGLCDESYYEGTLDSLKALGKKAPTQTAGTQQPMLPAAGTRWVLQTAMHFRPRPQLSAVPLGRLLPVGTPVVELEPPRGLPIATTSWVWCRTGGDVQGYLYTPNMRRVA